VLPYLSALENVFKGALQNVQVYFTYVCKAATDRITESKNSKTDQPVGEVPLLLLLYGYIRPT